jgi:hypothetical protein
LNDVINESLKRYDEAKKYGIAIKADPKVGTSMVTAGASKQPTKDVSLIDLDSFSSEPRIANNDSNNNTAKSNQPPMDLLGDLVDLNFAQTSTSLSPAGYGAGGAIKLDAANAEFWSSPSSNRNTAAAMIPSPQSLPMSPPKQGGTLPSLGTLKKYELKKYLFSGGLSSTVIGQPSSTPVESM